jgi:hypothetical protein
MNPAVAFTILVPLCHLADWLSHSFGQFVALAAHPLEHAIGLVIADESFGDGILT